MAILQQICDALGIPVDPTGGLGGDPTGAGGPPGPPAGPPGPPGAGGPPGGGPLGPGGHPMEVVRHERVTKPGETPPGGTPVGAPAFASVRQDHPWAHLAGKVASFEVADKIGDAPLGQIKNELSSLASEINYRVARLREDKDDDGNRVAAAVITQH
jgi:hypothetical protein